MKHTKFRLNSARELSLANGAQLTRKVGNIKSVKAQKEEIRR